MGIVVYLGLGVLLALTAFRAAGTKSRAERVIWSVASLGFAVVAAICAFRGVSSFPDLLFYALALISVISAVRVVSQYNPVHSAVWLITVFLCMAVLFILRYAEFLAAVQIIIYAGAIMVLYVFIIIFVDVEHITEEPSPVWMTASAIALAVVFVVALAPVALNLRPAPSAAFENANYGIAEKMGESIYFSAVIPFEAASLILLVALVGAALIGKAERE